MSRTRYLKPGFFTNPDLGKLPFGARLLFAGLWTLADSAGRMRYDVRWIKGQLFPFDDRFPTDQYRSMLENEGFVVTYLSMVGESSVRLLSIVNFEKHQRPHPKESKSTLPPPPEPGEAVEITRQDRDGAVETPGFNSYSSSSNSDLNLRSIPTSRRVEREVAVTERVVESWAVDEDDLPMYEEPAEPEYIPPVQASRNWREHSLNFNDTEWVKLTALFPGVNLQARWREWVLWIEEEENARSPKNKQRAFEGWLKKPA